MKYVREIKYKFQIFFHLLMQCFIRFSSFVHETRCVGHPLPPNHKTNLTPRTVRVPTFFPNLPSLLIC